MKHLKNVLVTIFLFLAGICCYHHLMAQQARYNRFQYHKYTWRALHTGMFHIYFPAGYDSLCRFASVQLPDIAAEIRKASGTDLSKIPNIIIYPSADQLYESNIGIYDKAQQTFPTINLKGSRIAVAFNGSYEDFRKELKEAWVRMSWEEVFKADMEEQLTNRPQLMPSWFKEGCIRYFSDGWPVSAEDRVMDHLARDAGNVDSFIAADPVLYGQAFCYFLSVRYRKDAARQIVAQLRQGKSLKRSVRLVTRQVLDTLNNQCVKFYRQRYRFYPQVQQENVPADSLLNKIAANAAIAFKQYSPDGKHIAFTADNGLKRSVYLIPVKGKDSDHKIHPVATYLLPPWISDLRKDIYPLISWEDDSRYVLIAMPEKGRIRVRRYTADGILADSRILYGVDGIGSLYKWDTRSWIMAAFRRGQSDIVLYQANKSSYAPLTTDLRDNTALAINTSRSAIAYRSGYPADSITAIDTPTRQYGIYYKDISDNLNKASDTMLARDSAYITWTMPEYDAAGNLTALYTASGTATRTVICGKTIGNFPEEEQVPWLVDYTRLKKEQDSIALLKQKLQEDNISLLGSILSPGTNASAAEVQRDSVRRSLAYTAKKVRPYLLQLYSGYFSASINNDYYINRYQPYKAYLGSFKFPEVGAMVQGGFSDLFDNHHFNIGYRMPSGTDGSDFFFRYENIARKLDWHIMYFRKVESLQPDPDRNWTDKQGQPYPAFAKVKTYYYELGFHYPLHYHWSLSLDIAARNDKTIFPATDRHSLNYDNLKQWWNINTLALQANKLQPTIPMLYKGWEGKIILDGMISGGENSTLLYGVVAKAAYHQPLYKKITAVLQLQAGHSGGGQSILYNFGGLDNNIVPRTDTTVQLRQDAPYAFQSLVTPFRGYKQNSIFGSSFGLVNADIYVPLFAELIPWRTSFGMINQLQIGVFGDIAFARRTEQILSPSPGHLYAYGCSARTMLAGYGLRFDIAWPGNFTRKPVWYLSLLL